MGTRSILATLAVALLCAGQASVAATQTLHALTLKKARPGGAPLLLYVSRHEGRLLGAWLADAPGHLLPATVETAKLAVGDAGMRGSLSATLESRWWGAMPNATLGLALTLDADRPKDDWRGTFAGTLGDAKIAGDVGGTSLTRTRTGGPLDARGYPCWRGAGGNGTAANGGHETVRALADVRLLWTSEEKTPTGYAGRGGYATGIQSGYASPIVADGRVYLSYYDAGGPTVQADYLAQSLEAIKAGTFNTSIAVSGLTPEAFARKRSAMEADDIILGIDAETGKTAWKTVFVESGAQFRHSGRGIAIQNKAADQATPCAADGLVIAVGSTGRIRAVDAASGAPVWQNVVPGIWDRLHGYLQTELKTGQFIGGNPEGECCAPAYAAGVVACGDGKGYTKESGKWGGDNNGLVGFDAATGARLWTVPKCLGRMASPIRWTFEGREYFLAVTAGTAYCIEPRTGTVLWRAAVAHSSGTPAVSGEYLLCSGYEDIGPACYRISPTWAKVLWSLETTYKPIQSPLISGAHGYMRTRTAALVCVDLATGKIAAAVPTAPVGGDSSPVAGDGLLFAEGGNCGVVLFDAAPAAMKLIGATPNLNYSHSTSLAYADGRLYLRCGVGLKCLELRKGGLAGQPLKADAPPALVKTTADDPDPVVKPPAKPPTPPVPGRPQPGPPDPLG